MWQKKIKKISCYLTNRANSDNIIKIVSNSLSAPLYPALGGLNPGLIFLWGILRGSDLILREAIKQKRDFIYIDHSYFKAGHNMERPCYRFVKNELQLTKIYDRPSDRFEELEITVKPWRKNGEYILVCPPSPSTSYFYNLSYNWLEKTLSVLNQITKKPIYVRYKPNLIDIDLSKGYAVPSKTTVIEDKISLAEHFERAYCVVTFNSMVAVQAICAGVPTIVDKISCASPVSRTSLLDIHELLYPYRMKWLYSLAYSQFYLDEIENGKAWEILDI